jgi:hypothetical protein
LSQVLVGIGAHRAGVSATSVDSYVRWDSGHYLSIADRGYYIEHCPPPQPAEDWCGNSAWMPAFSWVMNGVSRFGLELADAGFLIARLFHLAMLGALWFLFLRDQPRAQVILAVGIAAVFPGFIYQDAVFPISMATLAIIGSLALLSRGRFLLGGLVGAVATLSYSTGVFLAISGAAAILVLPSLRDWGARAQAAVLYCSPIAAAWLLMLPVFELSTGHWDAWFLTQGQYHHKFSFFLTQLWHRTYELTAETVNPRVMLVQTVVVFVMLVMGLAVLIRRRDRDDRAIVLGAFAVVFWIAPLSVDRPLGLYRSEALLVPIAGLLVRLPAWMQLPLLILLVPIGVEMSKLFFDSTLV